VANPAGRRLHARRGALGSRVPPEVPSTASSQMRLVSSARYPTRGKQCGVSTVPSHVRGVALDPSRQGFDVVRAGLADPLLPALSQDARVPGRRPSGASTARGGAGTAENNLWPSKVLFCPHLIVSACSIPISHFSRAHHAHFSSLLFQCVKWRIGKPDTTVCQFGVHVSPSTSLVIADCARRLRLAARV
jgi:hypothetical protein